MTNQEVIQQALARAHQQGFRLKGAPVPDYQHLTVVWLDERGGHAQVVVSSADYSAPVALNLGQLFLDVKFVRALFGELWEVHLNLLAATANPLDYLRALLPAGTAPSEPVPANRARSS